MLLIYDHWTKEKHSDSSYNDILLKEYKLNEISLLIDALLDYEFLKSRIPKFYSNFTLIHI